MTDDRRLCEWLDLASDVFARPQPDFPRGRIASQFLLSFDVPAVSLDWRDDSGRSGFQVWGEVDFTPAADLPPWHQKEIMDRHPLLQWFAATQDPTAQAIDRVPSQVASQRDRDFTNEYMKPVGIEKQLSMPYVVGASTYEAFVLGRPDDDYSDDDLDLARHLQKLIAGLHRHTSRIAATPDPDVACAAAADSGLTAAEVTVLLLLADGHTAYAIARRLTISPRTVNKHLEHVYRKLGVNDRLRALVVAQERGIVQRRSAPMAPSTAFGAGTHHPGPEPSGRQH
ncbi:response regulator transcription factor [Nocardioides sp. HB32]